MQPSKLRCKQKNMANAMFEQKQSNYLASKFVIKYTINLALFAVGVCYCWLHLVSKWKMSILKNYIGCAG